ncbi:hypothetical protein E8E13_006344 [Curvularia kusanoi]|uniref:F-box domain-containing protein n=1 Tax=Curvularia kusanoi TaxID=90978 RepID=A0A9P4TJE9_CURKU|nr:hypothetical protein E8E13_006344 [Curvularia kusanoi]
MPTELLTNIFTLLKPKDFNAARRTCRDWMATSLNKRLLGTMLLRGGWTSCDDLRDGESEPRRSASSSGDVWELSRALSRQCALSSGWTGNGLDTRPAIVESTDIDFSELGAGHPLHTEEANGGLLFTSSVCGNFLLVAKDALVFIYGTSGGLVQPLTSVVCPRKVLALSMNASVGRDAIAALLEGRMGMVCELRYGQSSAQTAAGSCDMCVEGDGHPPRPASQPNVSLEDNNDLQSALHSAEYISPRILHSYPCAQGPAFSSFNAIEMRAHSQGFRIRGTDDSNTYDRNHINNTWNLDLRGPQKDLRADPENATSAQSIPIESGTSTFYRHLCSEDDPPRNVSICPQRRCVAFGCSASIELHWIDALTGQSLSRWFPLTSPSDYLYFLSPRPGLESAKKLRLISSAAHPINRPAISRRLFNGSATRSFWGSVGFEGRYRQFHACDHYHAIPLSDGHHVLFVDPSNNRLTIGCDAPLGGPAKLLHKLVFISPEENIVPRIYTAASDLSSGARIVVMYGDTLVLYSVPVDALALSRTEQAAESWDVYNAPPFSPAGRHHDHWLNWWDEPAAYDPKLKSEALAIQTRPDITIWAFTSTSQCKTWRLRNYVDPVARYKQAIDRCGLTREVYDMDESGDAVMQDASFTSFTDQAVGNGVGQGHGTGPATENPSRADLDGNASGVLKVLPRALAVENDRWVDSIDIVSCADAWFEGGGDVVTWYEA